MAPTQRNFDYVVIGAGPSGLAAASHIAKSGGQVAIFEGRQRPDNVFGSYPVVLNARGCSAIRELGEDVLAKVETVGQAVKELHIVPENRTVAEVKAYGTCIMRDQVAQILLECAESKDNVTIFWEHKLESVDFEDRTCTFVKADGTKTTVQTPRLVAADGNRSKVRRACEEKVPGFTVEADPWGFSLRFMNSKGKPCQTGLNKDVHYVLGDKGYVCQQPNGVWSISLRVLPETDEEFLTSNHASEENVNKLKEYVERHTKVTADSLCDEDTYRSFYSCASYCGLVVKVSCLNPAGWICIIGDAAHAVQPATGEGINSGLEDAAVLGAMVRDHPLEPFKFYNDRQLPNAQALNKLALEARDKVLGVAPRDMAENIMVQIGLSIGKKLRIIDGTYQDFMLGEKALENPKTYAELVDMNEKQTKGLRPVAKGIARLFRLSKEPPLAAVAAYAAMKKQVAEVRGGEAVPA